MTDYVMRLATTEQAYVMRRAADAYEWDGVLPLDILVALDNAGLVIEDVMVYIEERENGR